MKYRKKPVEVEAYQITRRLIEGVLFDGGKYPEGLKCVQSSCHPPSRFISTWVGVVITIHGQETKVIENDWIIAEPDGIHFYPCKPDIFEKTYQPADESPSGSEAWVSVEDGLPPYTDNFYYWLYSESIDNYEQGEYNHDLGYFTDKVGDRLRLVSHWKIPTPPIK